LLLQNSRRSLFFAGACMQAHFVFAIRKRMFRLALIPIEKGPAQEWKRLHLDSILTRKRKVCLYNELRPWSSINAINLEREYTKTHVLFEAAQDKLRFRTFSLDSNARCCLRQFKRHEPAC